MDLLRQDFGKLPQKTRVVNLYKEPYDIYIGRPGKGVNGYFGNPIPLRPGDSRGSTLDRFHEYFFTRLEQDPEFKAHIMTLKGKTLGCFCKPNACHGDIIVEYLNSMEDL
jgi:hypothetical protein